MSGKPLLRRLITPNTSLDYALVLGIMAATIAVPAGAPLVAILGAAAVGYLFPKVNDGAIGEFGHRLMQSLKDTLGIGQSTPEGEDLKKLRQHDTVIAFEALERGNDPERVFSRLKYISAEEVIDKLKGSKYREWIPQKTMRQVDEYRAMLAQQENATHSQPDSAPEPHTLMPGQLSPSPSYIPSAAQQDKPTFSR